MCHEPNVERITWILYLLSSIFALICLVALIFVEMKYINVYTHLDMNYQTEVNSYWTFQAIISGILFSVLSISLIASYLFLKHMLDRYFSSRLFKEKKMVSLLFAVFCVCYILRTFYQLGLGNYHYIVC